MLPPTRRRVSRISFEQTGNLQKMAEALYLQLMEGLSAAKKRDALLLVLTWSMYVVGGIVGAALASCSSSFCNDWSLSPACMLYGPGMLSMLIERPKPPPKPAEVPPPQTAVSVATGAATSAADVAPQQMMVEVLPSNGAATEGQLVREVSVQGEHPTSPNDGRRALGEEPQL